MKRKILILGLAVVLLLSMSVSAFAADVSYPELPEGFSRYFITNNGTYGVKVHCFDGAVTVDGTDLVVQSTRYDLVNGKWVNKSVGPHYTAKSAVVYDSFGVYATNSATFFKPPISSSDLGGVLDNITKQINVTKVVQTLVVGVTAAVVLVFMWWGVRKLSNVLMVAFRNGKIKL